MHEKKDRDSQSQRTTFCIFKAGLCPSAGHVTGLRGTWNVSVHGAGRVHSFCPSPGQVNDGSSDN